MLSGKAQEAAFPEVPRKPLLLSHWPKLVMWPFSDMTGFMVIWPFSLGGEWVTCLEEDHPWGWGCAQLPLKDMAALKKGQGGS